MPTKKIVLAYSGGLDTSVAIPWLRERYTADVIALTLDVGQERDLSAVRQKALKSGAAKAMVVDAKQEFAQEFVWPALQAGAIYEGVYPLATALARPLIARHQVRVALAEGAYAVAHGCTGKGNDQVRFDVSTIALAPQLEVIAPARLWGMSRDEEKEYARARGIPVPESAGRTYSVDENLWGRSIEGEDLEDPWGEPPEAAFAWTRPVDKTPEKPIYLEIEFRNGVPIALNGEEMEGVALVLHLNRVAGECGVGRVDHVENRLVGIKSREVYEAPAATVLHAAHRALETLTLSKEQVRLKDLLAQQYADLVYNGLWFTALREDLNAFVQSTQRFVSGAVRVRLHRGACVVAGRKSPHALYQMALATYGAGDQFDHRAAEGFIKVYGLPVRTQTQVQLGPKTK
ncbi:MAG: argininosuccinate synthase [Chloroflexi bacterium]|nr:argininosuccinate synthase [Chloroflexota bacterium]